MSATTLPVQEAERIDRLICHCFQVVESTIRQAIDAQGADSLNDVLDQTCAGRGCNACHLRIRRMLAGDLDPCGPFSPCEGCGLANKLCECPAG
ncbi:MAG: (2Fe-2S)-binding protein [Planctomycetota bacterium]|nr:MAG: (2Fe-2S)-binding protein [Planctomycetota bacterium]REK22864.1 MAG: (2Fe-2S)-binding protein [Planctomycetota bacterium]REK37436.1 MAG: (2Fe-2S)-binding protein [Planctomycetota bacterium]